MKNEDLGVKNEGINYYDRYILRLQFIFFCFLDIFNIIFYFFILCIYKIGGEGGVEVVIVVGLRFIRVIEI